jgi:hypothetical protein
MVAAMMAAMACHAGGHAMPAASRTGLIWGELVGNVNWCAARYYLVLRVYCHIPTVLMASTIIRHACAFPQSCVMQGLRWRPAGLHAQLQRVSLVVVLSRAIPVLWVGCAVQKSLISPFGLKDSYAWQASVEWLIACVGNCACDASGISIEHTTCNIIMACVDDVICPPAGQ